jgi:hypothetical protein
LLKLVEYFEVEASDLIEAKTQPQAGAPTETRTQETAAEPAVPVSSRT